MAREAGEHTEAGQSRLVGENVPHEIIPCDILPPATYRDLPEAPPWKRLIGPSILLLGLSIGSGEFVLALVLLERG